MAKGPGNTRASTWRNGLYNNTVGKRQNFNRLPISAKQAVVQEKASVIVDMKARLIGLRTPQVIDNGQRIEIEYSSKGINHFANDAMVVLSGKYFSRDSMLRVNEILEQARYIPTSHMLVHPRRDNRELWFSYKPKDGRNVYFSVSRDSKTGRYELYSVRGKHP